TVGGRSRSDQGRPGGLLEEPAPSGDLQTDVRRSRPDRSPFPPGAPGRRPRRCESELAMFIRKDDQVEVIAGDDKGTPSDRRIARGLRVLPARNKIVVEGVNRVYKHMRPSQKNPQGGRLSKEMPIDVSNVLLFCPKCNRGVRVGRRFTDDGQK